MKLKVVLSLGYAAAPGVEHDVVVSDGTNTFNFTLTSNNNPVAWTDGTADVFPQLATTLGGSGLTVTAGPGGCPGPIIVQVQTSIGAQQEFAHAVVSTAVFSGTGTLTLNTGSTDVIGYDRGYDYYVVIDMDYELAWWDGDVAYPDFAIQGLTHANFLATSYQREVVQTYTSDRFVWGLDPYGVGVIFGVNESDLAALSSMTIELPGPFRFNGGYVRVYVSKGFRSAAALLVRTSIAHIVDTSDARHTVTVFPDWSRLRTLFPGPNATLPPPPPPRRNNTLLKRIDTTFIPGSPGVPAFAGQPALPARTVTVSERVCAWGPDYAAMARMGWTYNRALAAQAGGTNAELGGMAGWLPPGFDGNQRTGTNWAGHNYSQFTGGGWLIPYATTCQIINRQVTFPAQPFIPPRPAIPPVPAQTLREFHIGWTGRARSIRTFSGNGRVRFKAPAQLSAAVVGLNSEFRTTGFSDMRFAFRLENRVARIIDQGGTETYIGPYNDGDTFEIQRLDRQITYRINGTAVRTVPNSGSPLHLDAIMFMGGDSIYDPEIQELTSGRASLTPLASNGGGIQFTPPVNTLDTTTAASLQALTSLGWGSARPGASGVANLRPLVVFSRPAHRSEGSLQPIFGLAGDRPYAASAVALSVLTSEGEGGLGAPSYAVSNGMVGFLTGGGIMYTGGLISGDVSLQPMVGQASDRTYGAGAGSLSPLDGTGSLRSAAEMLDANVMDLVLAGAGVEMFGELAVVINSTGRVTGLISYVGIVNAAAMTSAQANTSYVLSALLSANAITNVAANSIDAFTQQGDAVWVVNTTTGSSTRYEKFGFNSFARIAGKYYGAKEGGVYLLEGDTDDGADIASMIAVGKQNFGTTNRSAQMRLENCYMAVASDGRLVLKVRAEGREYIYRTRSSSTELQTQRVDIGRGIRANFMEFEIWNENGDDFDIQTLEFAAVVLSRRI